MMVISMKNNNLKIDKKTLKNLKISVLAIDTFAIILLIIQIMFKTVTYVNLILLIILNICIFILEPKDETNN